MADDEEQGFTFGDFKFAPSPTPQPHINGVTSTSINDDIWGDFFISPQSSSSSQSKFNLSNNGFSPSPPNPSNWAKPTSTHSPIRPDPDFNKLLNQKGALPLSLFGEVQEIGSSNNNNTNGNSNRWFDPNPPSQNGKSENGSGLNFDGASSDLIIINNNSNNNDDDGDEDEDDDEWEFKGAFSGNGIVEEGNLKGVFVVSGLGAEPLPMMNQEKQAGQGASNSVDPKPGSISFASQSIAVPYGNGVNRQAREMDIGSKTSTNNSNGFMWDLFPGAQDIVVGSGISACSIKEDENGANCQSSEMDFGFKSTTSTTNSFLWDPFPGVEDIDNGSGVTASSRNVDENGANHQSSEMNVGLESTTSTTNGLIWDPFSGVEHIGNENGISATSINADDDFDDFGDFVDASQEVVSNKQEQVVAHTNPAESQLSNGEIQEKQNQTEHSRGALPLSLFSDDTEDSSNCLNLQNEAVSGPTLSPGKSFSGQASGISIHDLISNLYSQVQCTSVDSAGKSAENGVTSPTKAIVTAPLDEDDELDDGSWEFKGASTENGVGVQLSTVSPGYITQKQSVILPEMQNYCDFYEQLKDSLCFLLSCQLDELKKASSSDALAGNGGKEAAFDDEISEAFKLLESVMSKEECSKKGHDRNSSVNKLLEVLQGPNFNVIESDFSLSKRLQLAANEWRVAAELLRHAISMLELISLGSADEQSLYASTWSKIINVCVQELRYGASIWKRASEKNVQYQILSDSRGQPYLQALAEIYKVVQLLALSAKVYKPWMLLNVSDFSQFYGVLDECDALWSNSGLEEAVQRLSENVDFEYSETAKSLLAVIKNMREIDIISMHDRVLIQQKSICRLSLLPQEMLADVKTVTWCENTYFLNLANLWANLISCDPPQLPLLQVS